MMRCYMGVDVGSVSTNIVLINEDGDLLKKIYLRTRGQPIATIQDGFKELSDVLSNEVEILGVGTTGSGRHLAGVIVGADVVKNEITAHAVAASFAEPDVQTVIEIGGQDSKIIILRNGVAVDFAMNTVCAAGTGSFLDQQAARLGIPIEEFGSLALKATAPVRIAGRCTVFAESDMVHKQQMGHSPEDIVAGLSQALVRNYLNNVGKGKEILSTVVFQGGVAANQGIKVAFEEALGLPVIVPCNFAVMGAIGAALLAKEEIKKGGRKTKFKGLEVANFEYRASSFECDGCSNCCEIIEIMKDNVVVARWGGRCPKWEMKAS
jgi:predicted CoA-substrate-specific enzyme activase